MFYRKPAGDIVVKAKISGYITHKVRHIKEYSSNYLIYQSGP